MNFSFLHSGFLWALPAVLAPILLHRLSRRAPRPRLFSSIDLLEEILREQWARRRLKDRLLLLIRCFLFLILILLFARPVFHSSSAWTGGGEGMTVLLLLDVSYSMRAAHAGSSAFERAKAEAEKIIEGLDARDRLGLVFFSDRVELSLPPLEDRGRARDALSVLTPGFRPTRIFPALEAAAQMLSTDDRANQAVVILSDLAENGWRDPPAGRRGFGANARVLLAGVAPERSNAEIVSFSLRETAGRLSGQVSGFLRGRVRGEDGPAPRGWKIAYAMDALGEFSRGAASAGGRVSFPGDELAQSLSFERPPEDALFGVFSWDADAAPEDDRFFFPVDSARPLSVLIVNGQPGLTLLQDESYFLRPVVEDLAAGAGSLRAVSLRDLRRADISDRDLVLLLNPGPLSQEAGAALSKHLESGGGLWVTSGVNMESVDAWPPFFPARRRAASAPGPDALSAPRNSAHPLARALSEDGGFDWASVSLERFADIEPLPESETILSSRREGKPVFVTGRWGKGRTALFASTIDRDWTNLPTKPLFPVLARETLLYLAGRSDRSAGFSLRVDEPFQWEPPASPAASYRVERPDGRSDEAFFSNGRVSYGKTDTPGGYVLRAPNASEPAAAFVVNVNVESGEGDPARVSDVWIGNFFTGSDVTRTAYPASASEAFRNRLRGKDLASALAVAALFLFILEGLLSASARRKTHPALRPAWEAR